MKKLSDSSCCVSGPGLLAAGEGQAGLLARACFLQLDADSADEALLNQALKCIVFLALPLYEQDAARDLIPSKQQPSLASPSANGTNGDSIQNGLHAEEPGSANQANGQHSDRLDETPDAEPDGAVFETAGDQLEQETDGDDQDDAGGGEDWQLEGQTQEDSRHGSFTLAGLVRRMSSIACDR